MPQFHSNCEMMGRLCLVGFCTALRKANNPHEHIQHKENTGYFEWNEIDIVNSQTAHLMCTCGLGILTVYVKSTRL